MASSNMTLKLLVDKKAQKVLFAEATKEFMDFLFQIFSLPLGTLIQFLGTKEMVGCLGELKESLESFNQSYLQPSVDKDDIFNLKTAFEGDVLLLPNVVPVVDKPDTPKTLYRCSFSPVYNVYSSCSHLYVTEHQGDLCPSCRRSMNVPDKDTAVVKKRKLTGGYVKDVVTYMVMDNLVVKPMSTISSITLINSFGVKDLSQLEEKTLSFGKDEAVKLLKASLMTDQVLTTLFKQHV